MDGMVDGMDPMFKAVAKQTEGFSGRQLAKLAASVQGAVFGSESAALTPDLVQGVLDDKVCIVNIHRLKMRIRCHNTNCTFIHNMVMQCVSGRISRRWRAFNDIRTSTQERWTQIMEPFCVETVVIVRSAGVLQLEG